MLFGLIKEKDKKDPAEIANEFMESDVMKDKPEGEEKPEEKDEKPTELGSESSPEEKAEEEKKAAEEAEKEAEEAKKKEEEAKEREEEEKEKKRNPRAEKRISELTAKFKALEEDTKIKDKEYSMRIDMLEKEKEDLRREFGVAPENKVQDEVKSLEQARIKKYIEEDSSKPREERREMSKSEYEEWVIEDLSAANEWLVDQKLRRVKERDKDSQMLTAKTEVDKIQKSQQISRLRVEARHPELNIEARREELKSEGLDDEAIHDKIYEENEKYRVMADIIRGNKDIAEKLLLEPNGPEIMEKEMLRRLNTKPEKPEDTKMYELEEQIAELQEALNIENSRKKSIDEGIVSKKGASKVKGDNTKNNADVDHVLSMFSKKGYKISKEEYADMVERRRGIKGADQYADAEERRA